MSSLDTKCNLSSLMRHHVINQWYIIERLFKKIDKATSEELYILNQAKLKLEYVMSTGKIYEDESDREELQTYNLIEESVRKTQNTIGEYFIRSKQREFIPALYKEEIEIPYGLTTEHIEIASHILGGDFQITRVPTIEEIKMDDRYFRAMFPTKQNNFSGAGFRPTWWGVDGKHYEYSLKEETKKIGGTICLIENIIKPKSPNGKYENSEGRDPLAPIIQRLYGKDATRFNHSYESLNRLLEHLTELVIKAYNDKKIANVPVRVSLMSAMLGNIYFSSEYGRENMDTNTLEWTSTPYLRADNPNFNTGMSLYMGSKSRGGAAYVYGALKDKPNMNCGFRIAVMFGEKK